MSTQHKFQSFFLIIILALACGCSSKNHPIQRQAQGQKITSLKLTKAMQVSADNQKALIGNFAGLAVHQNGTMYVADSRLQKVRIFSPDGQYISSLGRKGKGPGEFIQLNPQLRILGDTLYVMGRSSLRINLFNVKTRELIQTIKIPEAKVDGVTIGTPRNLFPLPNGNLLIFFVNPYFLPPKKNASRKKITVSLMTRSGNFVKKNLLQFPTPYPTEQKLVFIGSGIYAFTNIPFYPMLLMETNAEGYIYIGKTDSLKFAKYNKSAKLIGTLSSKYQRKPLTDAYVDSLVQNKSQYFEKALESAGRPAWWPAFSDFLVDDNDRLWVKIVQPYTSMQTWWGFDENGKMRWKFQLPVQVNLDEIQDDMAYGIIQPEDGTSTIIKYNIEGMP